MPDDDDEFDLDDGGCGIYAAGNGRYTREMAEVAAAVAHGRFVVHATSRVNGEPVGRVKYTFYTEGAKQAFLAGHWPLRADEEYPWPSLAAVLGLR